MSESNETARLVRSGHDPVDILASQISPLSVARIFSVSYVFIYTLPLVITNVSPLQLDPLTVWLREEFGNGAFFPDGANAKFDLPHDVVRLSISLIVEGSDRGTSSAGSSYGSVPVATPPVALRPNVMSTMHSCISTIFSS